MLGVRVAAVRMSEGERAHGEGNPQNAEGEPSEQASNLLRLFGF